MGSSPRMRGTRSEYNPQARMTGIIPAHAGNTFQLGRVPYRAQDHPRACGEHAKTFSAEQVEEGSSPRMRGTQHLFCLTS